MPNWCSNTLAVFGPTADVVRFMEDNKATDEGALSFARALPTPDQTQFEGMSYSDTKDEPNYWYNWNVNNWGTKWDLDEEVHVEWKNNEDGTSMAFYTFDSAWAPPTDWLAYVAPLYPELNMKIEYREDGMGFAGILGFHHGEEVENQYWEQSFHSDVDQYDEIYGEA